MKSLASLSLLLCAAALAGGAPAVAAQEPPPAEPSGYDAVGRAGLEAAPGSAGVFVRHAALPRGSVVEVTALDSGQTILARIESMQADPTGNLLLLSPAAAAQLGAGEGAAVRVRPAIASPQERARLDAGQAAPLRIAAPPALLAALRRRLSPISRQVPRAASAGTVQPVRPVAVRTPAPRTTPPAPAARAPIQRAAPAPARAAAAITGGFVVQVATLSDVARARALARTLGGGVSPKGTLYRVRLGPYASRAEAERARSSVARRGHPDAQILRQD